MHESPRSGHYVYMKPAIQQLLARITQKGLNGETDTLLLSRFVRDRDQSAFAAILERYGQFVWGVCRGLLLNQADAEDAFQATFVALFRGAARIRQTESLAPWLHTTATRIAKKIRLKAARRTRREQQAARSETSPALASDATWESLNFALHDEISRLPERLRVAFVMCVLEGKRYEDAATQLGIPVGTLSARVSRARTKVLDRLSARGLTPAIAVAVGTASATAAVSKPILMQVRRHLTDGFTSVPKSVRILAAAAGGSSMTMKWIGVTGILGFLFTALVVWSLWPAPDVAAAPAPKVAPDKGVIWVYHPKADNTATFTAYTPDGRKEDDFAITNDDCYIGFTPDGRNIAFAGKRGKIAESRKGDGLTVHLRAIGDAAEVTDTGIPAGEECLFPVWSPDMKKAIFARVTYAPGGILTSCKCSHFDIATKKETPLDLPGDHRVVLWSPDGKWLLVYLDDHWPTWKRYTLADAKMYTLFQGIFPHQMDLSPDGKTLIGLCYPQEAAFGRKALKGGMTRLDSQTGAMTMADKFTRLPNDIGLVISRWSLDGKRVAHSVREKNAEGEESARIVICDPDGGNEVRLADIPSQFMGFIYWLPSRHKVADPPPK